MSQDIYQEVTDRIVAELERGTVPWRRPWVASGTAHRNPVSGTEYRGVNPLLLEITAQAAGYDLPLWLTFNQAKARGGSVRRGERSTAVIFWKVLQKEDEQTGKKRSIPMLRSFRVFNVAQVDGLEGVEFEVPEVEPCKPYEEIERAQQIIDEMPDPPMISHGGSRAYYHPSTDLVILPDHERFELPDAYYAVAFHELAHATGHETRLNREEVMRAVRFGDDMYSREELVAELASAMIGAHAGIEPRHDQNAAYVASWLKALRGDKKMLISTAGRAQRAADYILGKSIVN